MKLLATFSTEKLKSISSVDRLSTSVSDYILKLEKEDYSDYSRGFYTSQLDNLAKVFATPTRTASLTDHAKNSLASKKLDATARSELARNKEITEEENKKCSKELVPEKVDDIEKASGANSDEPTYQEILDTFKKGLESEELENDQSVQKEPDVIQTAEANSKVFPAQDAMEKSNEESPEIKENIQEPANRLKNSRR